MRAYLLCGFIDCLLCLHAACLLYFFVVVFFLFYRSLPLLFALPAGLFRAPLRMRRRCLDDGAGAYGRLDNRLKCTVCFSCAQSLLLPLLLLLPPRVLCCEN